MAKPMFITLEPVLGAENENVDDRLAKKVDEAYLGRPVRDAVQKLLDPDSDEYNPEYNAYEKGMANQIQRWFHETTMDPRKKVQVSAYTNDVPPNEIPLDLNKVLSDYSDRILKTREQEEDGQRVPYNLIELCVSPPYGGGLDSLMNHSNPSPKTDG